MSALLRPAAFLAAVVIALLAPVRALAQSDSGTIAIAVVDAASKRPLAGARVVLEGPILASEASGADGKVTFTNVPSGIYQARVFKGGYGGATSKEFEVLPGRAVTLTVALARTQTTSGLKVIAKITVTARPGTGTDVGSGSAVRRLSDDLVQALGKLPGVNVDDGTGSGNTDAAETISLDGHDPSQTAVSLDGIPLNAPGQAANMREISTDLFAGASVAHGPMAGALGGGVNFRTLEPTLTWQGELTTSVGSRGAADTVVSERGTFDGIGVAFVHAVRGSDGLLYGQRFLDSSGLDYAHGGSRLTGGDMVKLRAHLGGTQTLTASYLSSNFYTDLVCTTDTGPLPCGYGPGNAAYGHFTMSALSDTALVGLVGLQLSAYGISTTHDTDLLDRYVGGVPDPYGTDSLRQTHGMALTATLPARGKHTLSVQAATSHSTFTTTPINAQTGIYLLVPTSATTYSSLTLDDRIDANARLRLGEEFGVSSSTGAGSSLLVGSSATWSPTSRDVYTAQVDAGNAGATPPRIGILTDPAGLRFDCAGGIAYGNGPGDEPAASSSFSARAGWEHLFRGGDLSATLYRQQQNGTLVPTEVNAAALPAGYFPVNYFALAQQAYDSAGGCGGTGAFAPSNLYLTIPLGGVTRVYQGLQLGGEISVGRSLVVQGSYTVQSAALSSADPRLMNPYSTTISGDQLPGVPLHRAAVLLDEKAPGSAVEALADAQYTSANNPQNLPAYVTVDAGVTIHLQHGTLSFLGTNLFDTHGGAFATANGGVPLATLGGTLLPTIVRPLAPRNLSVTYAVPIGPGAASAAPPSASLTPLRREGGPGGPGGYGGPGGPDRRRGFFQPLPSAPPSSPLALDANRPACDADAAAQARPILDALAAYGDALVRAKAPSGYPAGPPVGAPAIPGFAVAYRPTPGSYALSLVPTDFASLRALARCATLHIATESEARAHGLYVPAPTPFGGFALAFSPRAGLYAVRRPPAPGREQFRLYRLPSTKPAHPFAAEDRSSCTPQAREVAVPLLDALARYAAELDPAHPPAWQPKGWSVSLRRNGSAWWLEAHLVNIQTVPALLDCAHVSIGTREEVAKLALGGSPPPSLDYAPALGLYTVRNDQPRRPQGPTAPSSPSSPAPSR